MEDNVGKARKIITVIEEHPGSWIFFGFLVFWISGGGLNIDLGQVIKLKQSSFQIISIITQILSLFLVFSGIYRIITNNSEAPKPFTFGFLSLIWIILSCLLAYTFFIKPKPDSEKMFGSREFTWYKDYNVFNLEINYQELENFYHQDKALLFVLYERYTEKHRDLDDRVGVMITDIYPILEPGVGKRMLPDIRCFENPKVRLGDDVYIQAFSVPKNFNKAGCFTIRGLEEKGAKPITWATAPVELKDSKIESLIEYINDLNQSEKKNIKESILIKQ